MMWFGVEGSSCGESSVLFLPEGMDVECLVCREVASMKNCTKEILNVQLFGQNFEKGS